MLKTVLKWLLITLELFVAAGAFFGGVQLIRDPSGGLMQMPAAHFLTSHSLFSDWFIPGIILLVANGLVPLVVLVGAVLNVAWAKLGHVAVGTILLGWMIGQALIVGVSAPIQVFFIGLAVFLLLLGLTNWVLDGRGPSAPLRPSRGQV